METPGTKQKKVNLSVEEFYSRAQELISTANAKGIHLRMLGAAAVYHQLRKSEREKELFTKLGRIGDGISPFTDLDLVTYKKEYGNLVDFLEKDLGYLPEKSVNVIYGLERNIYHSPDGSFDIDIFYSCLNFSHKICWGNSHSEGQLPDDDISIKIDDIIAEKLQIHDINRKDLIDLLLLFMYTSRNKMALDYKLLIESASDDWGYWYDSKVNLEKVAELVDKFSSDSIITKDEENFVKSGITELVKKLDESPKTRSWKRRAKKGTSAIWYNVVEEVER